MNHDRIGAAFMLIAAAWLVMLVFTDPGDTASTYFRVLVCIAAAVTVITAIFPRHLYLTGTVLAFTVLGLSLHVGLFGIFGIGLKGLLPAILLAFSLWFRRDRLDASGVVLVTALVACGLAIAQPAVLLSAFAFIGIVNVLIWLANAIGSIRTSRR